ncbi:hypothetical protein RUM44_004947 [Polyplax serrata]|uniref:Uncharacterized protein n=1 Tax=Polyplax serrata TaxID=468196 RepID=A0ABR1AWL6_POLSC
MGSGARRIIKIINRSVRLEPGGELEAPTAPSYYDDTTVIMYPGDATSVIRYPCRYSRYTSLDSFASTYNQFGLISTDHWSMPSGYFVTIQLRVNLPSTRHQPFQFTDLESHQPSCRTDHLYNRHCQRLNSIPNATPNGEEDVEGVSI